MGRVPVWRDDRMTVSKLANDFLRYKAARGGSPRTGENYDMVFGQFRAFLAAKRLEDDVRNFTGDIVNEFVQYLLEQGNKPSTVGTKLSALASLAAFGMRTKDARGRYILAENPVTRVERPKAGPHHERYLYAQEIKAMLAAASPGPEKLALRFLLDTQLRASAAVNARVRDLSQDGDRLLLQVIEKGGRPAVVELPPDLARDVLEFLKHREAGPDETILISAKGKPYTRTSLSEMIARVAKKAGVTRVPVRAHLFARHSPASLAGQAGATEFEIAALLRHANTSTARRYVHGVNSDAVRSKVREMLR